MHAHTRTQHTIIHNTHRVFTIVREEGGADGGAVVQDCLELLNNLLRANQVGFVILPSNSVQTTRL